MSEAKPITDKALESLRDELADGGTLGSCLHVGMSFENWHSVLARLDQEIKARATAEEDLTWLKAVNKALHERLDGKAPDQIDRLEMQMRLDAAEAVCSAATDQRLIIYSDTGGAEKKLLKALDKWRAVHTAKLTQTDEN